MLMVVIPVMELVENKSAPPSQGMHSRRAANASLAVPLYVTGTLCCANQTRRKDSQRATQGDSFVDRIIT